MFKNFIYNNISVLNKLYLFLVTISLSIFIFENINHLANFQIVLSSKKAMAVVNVLTIICLFVHLIEDKKKFLLSVVLLTFSYLIYKFSPFQNNYYLNFVKISIAYSLCKPHFILRVALFSLFISVLLVFSLYFSELTDKEIYATRDGSVRNAFGFGHPNGTGLFILALSLLFWCSFKGKLSNLVSIVIFLSAYLLISSYIDSRTSEILCIVSAGFALIYLAAISIPHDKIKSYLLIISKYICISGLSILSIGYLLFCYFYNPEIDIYRQLNDLLSTRIQLTHDGLIKFGISLWGSIVQFADINPTGFESVKTVSYNYLDSLYVYIPVCHGIFALILLNIAYIIVVRKAFKAGYHRIGITLFILSVYSISESYFIQIASNIFIYLLLTSFEEEKKKSIEEYFLRLNNYIQALNKKLLVLYSITKKLLIIVTSVLTPAFILCKNYVRSIYSINLINNTEQNELTYTHNIYSNNLNVNCDKELLKIDNKRDMTFNSRTQLKEIHKGNKSLYLFSGLFFAFLISIVSILFEDIVSLVRTIVNLKEHFSIKPFVISFIIILLFTVLFVKSLYELYLYTLLKVLLKRSYSLKFNVAFNLISYSLFIMTFGFIFNSYINQEIENRQNDFILLKDITNHLDNSNVNYDLYVDKVPYLYKDDFKIKDQLFSFDHLALENRPMILVTCPDDMHYMLTMYGYKFAKLTEKMAIFVKDQNLINNLTNNSIKISDIYHCKKNIALERIAKLNNIRLKNQKSISLKSMDNIILDDIVYMPNGNYNLSFTLMKNDNTDIPEGTLGFIQLTASLGGITLHLKEFSKNDFVNNNYNYNLPLHISNGYHNVELKLYFYRNIDVSLESVIFEKLDQ